MKKMFKQMGIKDAYKDFKDYTDMYEKYKKYLLSHEDEYVDWDKGGQVKYYACYDYDNDFIYSNSTIRVRTQGVTYTTKANSIMEFVDVIGKDNFKKYILGIS